MVFETYPQHYKMKVLHVVLGSSVLPQGQTYRLWCVDSVR